MIFLFKCLLKNLTSQSGVHFPHVGPVTCDILWNVSGCIDFKIYTYIYIYCKITIKTQAKTYSIAETRRWIGTWQRGSEPVLWCWVEVQLTVNMSGIYTSVSHVKAQRTWFHFNPSIEVMVYKTGAWMPLCVKSMRDFVKRHFWEFMTYMLLFWGGVGFCLYFFGGGWWCFCSGTPVQQVLANMNPSDCTVVSFLSQQVVRPVGTRPRGLRPSHEGTQSCYFCFGFYFGTWQ